MAYRLDDAKLEYAGILLFGPEGTNFSEILIEIYTFSFKKMHLAMPSGKCRTFCLGLNVLSALKKALNSGSLCIVLKILQNWIRSGNTKTA